MFTIDCDIYEVQDVDYYEYNNVTNSVRYSVPSRCLLSPPCLFLFVNLANTRDLKGARLNFIL